MLGTLFLCTKTDLLVQYVFAKEGPGLMITKNGPTLMLNCHQAFVMFTLQMKVLQRMLAIVWLSVTELK